MDWDRLSEVVYRFDSSVGGAKRQPLVEMMQEYGPQAHARTRAAIQRIKRCGEWRQRYFGGQNWPYRHHCKHPLCPACGPVLKQRELDRVWWNLCQLGRSDPQREHLSFITINIVHFQLGQDLSDTVEKTLRKLRYRVSGLLKAQLYGEWEIAPQQDGTGLLHLHGWIHHPGVAAFSVLRSLRKAFPEPRAVNVLPMYEEGTVEQQFHKASKYGGKLWKGITGFEKTTPRVVSGVMESLMSIRTRGRKGLRVAIGLRKKS